MTESKVEDNVVGLRGKTVLKEGEPVAGIVKHLEHLLEQAKMGKVHLLAYAVIDDKGFWQIGHDGVGNALLLLGGVGMLKSDLEHYINGADQ